VTMRQTHAAGERLFVDYAGDGVPVVIDRLTGPAVLATFGFFPSRIAQPNLPRTVDDIFPLYKVLRVCNRVSGIARRRR
jgi:hypothetical protein